MENTLKKYFAQGVFGTGRLNAVICLALAVGVYFTNDIYDLLNHGPAVLNLRTPLDAALPVVRPFVIPYVSLNPLVYFTLVVFLPSGQRSSSLPVWPCSLPGSSAISSISSCRPR